MARHWEKFTEGPYISSRNRMHVTLNSKGVFQFNRQVFDGLGKPSAVALFFEKATSTIGIGAAHRQLREAFPVNQRQDTYWTINAVPFCRHFGIKIDQGTEAFADPEIDTEAILQLDLRTTRRIYGGGGRRRKAPTETAKGSR